MLATDDAEGRLVLTVPSQTRAVDAIELGKNVLKAEAGFDFKDVFSQYRVKGQRELIQAVSQLREAGREPILSSAISRNGVAAKK